MKKAVIVGGSNGIGLAISKNLIDRGYYLEICDRTGPEEGVLDQRSFHHNYCDLLDFNEELVAHRLDKRLWQKLRPNEVQKG